MKTLADTRKRGAISGEFKPALRSFDKLSAGKSITVGSSAKLIVIAVELVSDHYFIVDC